MNTKDWQQIRFFTPQENWGNPGLMQMDLVSELDSFRNYLGFKMVVSCGTQGEHEKDSWHYVGRAVDILVPGITDHTLLDLFVSALRFGFTGVGLYRDWEYNGVKIGGLHLEKAPTQPAVRRLWLCVTEAGEKKYTSLTEETLKHYAIIGGPR